MSGIAGNIQGPRGPKGDTGASGAAVSAPTIVFIPAGETISALRVVRGKTDGKLYYCDSSTDVDKNTALGITVTSGNVDDQITVYLMGELVDVGWSWTPNTPVYLGLAGALTQTPPMVGFCQIIGTAETATKLKISIQQAISLA